MIVLHGRGQSVDDSVALIRRMPPSATVYRALSADKGSWYPQSFLAPVTENQPDLDAALEQIEAEVRTLEAEGWTRDRIGLVGFSQGACLACEYVYRHPTRWATVIAFTGGLIGPVGTTWPARTELAETSVLLTNGDADPWVPWQRTLETADALRSCDARVQVRQFTGREHLVTTEEIVLAGDLLSRASERSANPVT